MPMPARVAAPRPRPQGQAKPWWAKLGNDLLYEWRQSPIGAAWNQINVGMAGASDNGLRMGYSAVQRMQGRKKADPSSGRFGAELDRFVDQTYRKLGAKPPSQMSQAERNVDQMRRSVALNLVLAPVSPGFGAAKAATAVGMGLRGGAAFAVNEALSTFLDDNTSGNVANLLQLPGAVNVGQDDMVDAAFKSLLPNAAASLALGAGAGAAVAGFRNIRRNVRAHRAAQREVQQRSKQEAMGVLQKDEAGGYDFAPEVKQPTQPAAAPGPTFQEANAAMEQRLGAPAPAAPETGPAPAIDNATVDDFGKAQPGELPQADPAIDYWTYDPELPESTALGKTLEELSDQELVTLQQGAGLPVVERVNQTVEARAGIEPRPPMAAQMVMAPADRLADDYLESVTRKLGAREDYELRPLFDPEANQQLWQKAQALTGVDDPSQLSKADMLDTFNAMRADGQAPIVNRMMGGQMLPTAEVQAAPQVFQYKGGVNEAGEQIGNSLEGVERWDPNAENIIQVWRDANGEIGQPGAVYVVNGHNRLAAAKRMGIPSMRVEYLDSPTAGEARLQGAISNVSDGKGTVFDAAKLAREYGITDQAQLKALGKPGASGFWKEGIALGRVPEDVFTAAVNEQIPLRRAVIIGDSGVDEETMRSAYRYLVQQGPDNVKEGTLREMLAMAGQSPSASSSDGVQGTILDGTEWEQSFNEGLLAKADLASSVRLMLSKEKKLFGTVGRQSGQIERVGQVDAGAAKEISGEAGRALAIFDELKYQTGPVSDLLNEGTQRVLTGEQSAVVAKQIKNRLAAAIGEAMGKEVAPAADVVQEDMFAAAARAADEPQAPIELTLDERAMAEAQLLQEAIANGEVRPPNAPIPELPELAQVRLDELTLDEPLAPGSKAAQAAADEVRLALEHKQADAAMAWEQQQAARDAVAYEDLTFDQKKDAGLAQGIDDIYLEEMASLRADLEAGVDPPAVLESKAAKLAGLEQRFGKVVTPEVMPADVPISQLPKISDVLQSTMRALAESDARLYRGLGESLGNVKQGLGELAESATPAAKSLPPASTKAGKDIRKQISDLEERIRFSRDERLPAARQNGSADLVQQLETAIPKWQKQLSDLQSEYGIEPTLAPAPVRPEPLKLTAGAPQPEFILPQELSKSAPRYGRYTVKFDSDLDRAAYVLANDAVKPSKAAPKFRAAIEAAGMDGAEVVAHGKRVKAALKKAAQGNLTGQVELPAQPFGEVPKPPTKAGADRVRQQIEVNNQTMDDIRRKAQQEGC